MKKACLIAAVLSGLSGCSKQTTEAHTAPPSAAASIERSTPGIVRIDPNSPKFKLIQLETVGEAEVPLNEVVSPGKVEADQNRVSQVVLPVAGRIVTVEARIGDYVRQGQPLFSVESPDVESAVANYLQAQASVAQSRAALSKAQADYDRSKDLFEHNAIAKKEVLSAESQFKQTEAQLDQTLAIVQQSKRRLELLGVKPGEFNQKVIVRASISGKVMEMSVVPGEFRNDLSVPLMKIADLSTVWVTADVPETQIRMIDKGELVDLELAAYPGERFRGRVKQIADTVDPQSRTVKVRAEMPNPNGKLKPEMFGQIREVQSLHKSVVIPSSSAVLDDANSYVWKQLEPGVFQRTSVELTPVDGKLYAVKKGLLPGDRIVTDGAMLLKGMER
ncbi:efflux RND transporter periplasmic adaptor subunit [Bryobacter aggregatus]|uniref:efflux RND transporter periplasmic adaptor subunit n=1 Tax=Bryobacter aggregatus TaxID=360054 RepID=UPI0004E1E381|nr:efflux RND transporter periplasmic adaptor subunit [Bryobacter aggregatus]